MSALAAGDNGRDGVRTTVMADIQHRVTDVENEIKVLKNEIKAVLLDIREQYLNAENPFALAGQAGAGGPGPTINITQGPTAPQAVATGQSPATKSAVLEQESHSAEETVAETDLEEDGTKEATGAGEASSSPRLEPTAEEEDSATTGRRGKKKGSRDAPSLPSLGPSTEEEEESLPTSAERDRKVAGGLLPGLGPLEQEADRGKGKQATQYPRGRGNGDGITLLTIAGLSKWVDESTEKIGKERTEVMVEACHMVGHLSPELKDLLVKLVRLAQADETKRGKITTRDYLGVIAQLDNLLGYGNESEAALLSILADSREPSYG